MLKILITGASGFLGSIILKTLSTTDYELTTLGISKGDDIFCDLSNSVPVLNFEFDWVLHIAGMAHMTPRNEGEKQQFYTVNYQGTINLCKALEKSSIPKSFIFISTVAVYGVDSGQNITEDFPLNGYTPYALSKIQAENFLIKWCESQKVNLGILRPALIAGKNPPGNLGNMIKGIKSGRYFAIGNGKARKSILLADDLSRIIPKLAVIGGIYNICDDHHPSFIELENLITKQLGKKRPLSIPYWFAKCLAIMGDMVGNKFPINSSKLNKIVKPLTFSNEKAKRKLDWQPLDVLSNFRIQ